MPQSLQQAENERLIGQRYSKPAGIGVRAWDLAVPRMGRMPNDSGGSLSVASPIFDYVHFERLEHEGRREFGGQIAQLQKEVRKGLL